MKSKNLLLDNGNTLKKTTRKFTKIAICGLLRHYTPCLPLMLIIVCFCSVCKIEILYFANTVSHSAKIFNFIPRIDRHPVMSLV